MPGSARERLLRSYYREVPTHPDSIAGLARMTALVDDVAAEAVVAERARLRALVEGLMRKNVRLPEEGADGEDAYIGSLYIEVLAALEGPDAR